MQSSGVIRDYILHVLTDYDGTSLLPPLLNFRGAGLDSRQPEGLSGTSQKADSEGLIVVYPDGINGELPTWSGSFVTPGAIRSQAIKGTDVMSSFPEKHPMP